MLAAGFNSKTDEDKIALLINVGGAELKDIYNGLTWAAPTEDVPDESKVYTRVTAKMDAYVNVKNNQLSARRTFSTMSQRSTESLEQFITKIQTTVKSCDFGNEEEKTQMRDQLIFRCTDDALREKFYREKYENLTFDKAVEICQIYLSAWRQLSTFHGSSMKEHESVQAVKSKSKPVCQWLKSGAGQSSVKQNTKRSGQSSF